jgi:hemerythrin family non-heme iron protein
MTAYPVPTPFQWDTSFDIHHHELNEQHKKLFTMINDLEADMHSAAKLKTLLDFAVHHFKTEEDLFASHHYEDATAHKAIHDKFVNDAVAGTAGGVSAGVIKFLKEWLVNHIKVSDMKYSGKIGH